MKKAFLRAIAALLCLSLLFTLAACSKSPDLMKLEESERADAFFDLVNKDPADKYRVDMKMDISGSVYSVPFKAEINSETFYIDSESNSPAYHAEIESVINMGTSSSSSTQTVKSTVGYRDGKLYEYSDKDGVESALVSPMSADDYKKHMEFLAGMTDEEISALHKNAAKKECNLNEDSSWTATYSEYDTESISGIIDYCFDSTVTIVDGYRVKDVILIINATENFLPTEWKYELVFERTDETELYREPSAEITMTFKNFGNAEAPEVDLSKYKEVEGLDALREIRHLINEMTVAESGSFISKSNQRVDYAHSTTNTDETDVVTYNNENGKFSFNIDAYLVAPGMSVNNGTSYKIVYKDGKLTVTGDGSKPQTSGITDNDAKVYVVRILDPASLSGASVSDIGTGSGKYTHRFTLASPDYSALMPTLTSLNAKDIKADATVDVVYENGTLKEYEYVLTLTAKVDLQTLTVKITSTVTYETDGNAEL